MPLKSLPGPKVGGGSRKDSLIDPDLARKRIEHALHWVKHRIERQRKPGMDYKEQKGWAPTPIN